jgi:hypothetical protein
LVDAETVANNASTAGASGLQGSAGSMLAYEHDVDIELPAAATLARADEVQAACAAQTHGACSVLSLQTSAGRPISAVIVLRAEPAAIEPLLTLARTGGTLTARRTTAEDLAPAVASTHERKEYLTTLRRELVDMGKAGGISVAERITLVDRVAQIDTELQGLDTQQREHQRRIETNRLTLRLISPHERERPGIVFDDLWLDVQQSFFDGISLAIATLAIGLPMLIAGFPLLLAFRWAWRKTGASRGRMHQPLPMKPEPGA